MRILVVDDNETNRVVACLLLERRGHDVLVASCGPSALECMAKETLDVVLMDLSMPGMDGFETVRRFRASESTKPRLPIIALTAHSSIEDRQRSLEAGMNGLIAKPLNGSTIEVVLALATQLWEHDPPLQGSASSGRPAETEAPRH
jgi:CheY-like chemotaxis protein